jgi:Ras-related GTP-binding protein A/B
MRRKVLLLGMMGSGKTSMRSVIFANLLARDTRRLAPTIDVEQSTIQFMGDLVLNLWDCGTQDIFLENYFTSQRDRIFSNVAVLIYVFDVETSLRAKDINNFTASITALQEYSKNAKIFCLAHKMDLIPADQREEVFKSREAQIKQLSGSALVICYGTSIWDESLYKAWSSIVYSQIPNIEILENQLRNFLKICDADQVVLFERATFLVVAHASANPNYDMQLFEKISTVIKQFKLSCSKSSQAQFQSMQLTIGGFTAFIEGFTSNTFAMVITSDPSIQGATTMLNISVARKYFEKITQQNVPVESEVI